MHILWSGLGLATSRRKIATRNGIDTPRALWKATAGLILLCMGLFSQNTFVPLCGGSLRFRDGSER